MYFEPILITGAARSGTSMTAGIINLCGAFGGNMHGPNQNNQKGMFENIHVVKDIVKPYFRSLGVDPLGQYPLPDINHLKPYPDNWKDTILEVFKSEGLKEDQFWFYKGAKMCLFWHVWKDAFPEAKWIIVRRAKEEIINSCIKTSFMKAFDNRDGWSWWVDQHLDRFREMWDAGLQIREVWPRKIIDGDLSEIKDVINWLGLSWNEHKIINFVAPSLWHNRSKHGTSD